MLLDFEGVNHHQLSGEGRGVSGAVSATLPVVQDGSRPSPLDASTSGLRPPSHWQGRGNHPGMQGNFNLTAGVPPPMAVVPPLVERSAANASEPGPHKTQDREQAQSPEASSARRMEAPVRALLIRLAPSIALFGCREDGSGPALPEEFWARIAQFLTQIDGGAPLAAAIDSAVKDCQDHLYEALDSWASRPTARTSANILPAPQQVADGLLVSNLYWDGNAPAHVQQMCAQRQITGLALFLGSFRGQDVAPLLPEAFWDCVSRFVEEGIRA